MDNIYSLLIMFDYPDVITANLRSLNEKTRGDLTHALQQYKFQKLMTNSQEINQI
ncbi:translin [Methanohalophilus sp. WG1-DM]|nr:translin [Methanohalophilus sp. WG1-DM]